MNIRHPKRIARIVFFVLTIALFPAAIVPGQGVGVSQRNIISDIPGLAQRTDRKLVNPWGFVLNPSGQLAIANEGSGVLTIYSGSGKPAQTSRQVVNVPGPGGTGPGAPSGIVLNNTQGFIITQGTSAPARYIVVGTDGVISGWNPAVNAAAAVVLADNSAAGAAYTGATFASKGSQNFLVVANFGGGTIDVYDSGMGLVRSIANPNIDPEFSPFNVQNINGQLFVAYAKKGEDGDEERGPGLGFIVVFDASGNLVNNLVAQGALNAPWAMVVTPSDFGNFSNILLVGNFGDGRINAYDLATGNLRGTLTNQSGQPIEIEGLWGLQFSTLGTTGTSALYFAAGIADEEHGLFGRLTVTRIKGSE